jgi:hypothetical protein
VASFSAAFFDDDFLPLSWVEDQRYACPYCKAPPGTFCKGKPLGQVHVDRRWRRFIAKISIRTKLVRAS